MLYTAEYCLSYILDLQNIYTNQMSITDLPRKHINCQKNTVNSNKIFSPDGLEHSGAITLFGNPFGI